MILCIETATSVCSVALCDRKGVISAREDREGRSHAALLTVFINELLDEQKIKATELEAVAVSKGPGSFTGLRIGVSVAKGIAYRASIPLIGIDTLLSMFCGIIKGDLSEYNLDQSSLYCPMLDARRMEVFYSIFDHNGDTVKKVGAEIITGESFSDISENRSILFFGSGASKCEGVIGRKNNLFKNDFTVSAEYMQVPAYKSFNTGKFEDVAYFEPFYLKDFIATIPKKNIPGQ